MDLAGRTALISGATSGIGQAVAERLAVQVGTLIVHGLEPEASQAAYVSQLRSLGTAQVVYLQADFARLADVASLANLVHEYVDHLDLLVNNAVAPPARSRVLTADGHERAWQVDYLATAALTTRLGDIVRGRIVNIASETHRGADLDFDNLRLDHGYAPFEAYRQAKLAIVTFTQWLAPRLPGDGPAVVAACPGLTDTPLLHAMFPGLPDQSVAVAADNVLAAVTGEVPASAYLHDGWPGRPGSAATDPGAQERLIAETSAALGISLYDAFPARKA